MYPNNKRNRPIITYHIQEGPVRHLFKIIIQSVIGFSAILNQIQSNDSIDILEIKAVRAIGNLQNLSPYEFQIKTSLSDYSELIINPSTRFFMMENIWVDAEFYFYGILKDAGRRSKATLHLDTQDYGYFSIETGEEFLNTNAKHYFKYFLDNQ